MPTRASPFNVVAAFDFSPAGRLVLGAGLGLVRGRSDATLHVVHVADGYGPLLRLDLDDDVRTVEPAEAERFVVEHIREAAKEVEPAADLGQMRIILRVGHRTADEIAHLAADVDADMVVVGTHGRKGVSWLLVGSVAETVTRKTGCSVLVVRPKHHAEARQHD